LFISPEILADGYVKFRTYSVEGTPVNESRMQEYVDNSVMLVTALNSVIGYERCAQVTEDPPRKPRASESCALNGFIDESRFDEIVDPRKMINNNSR
jgi:fumarate hydratase, class II